MTTETEEIIERLRRVNLLQGSDIQIVLQGVKASLKITSTNVSSLAQTVLGLARLADSYGLHEVIICSHGTTNPLSFPVSALRYYGLDQDSLEQLQKRARKHQALLNALSKTKDMLFLHSQEEPYTYLDVRSLIEERLNVPLLELLGSPVDRVDSALADLRRFWLKRAVNLGAAQHYYYTHQWRAKPWRFRVDVAPLTGTEEAIAIVTDAEPWQRRWWKLRYSRYLVSQKA